MAEAVYSLTNFSLRNTDMRIGTVFTATATAQQSPLDNMRVIGGSLYLSAHRTYIVDVYLEIQLGSGYGETVTMGGSDAIRSGTYDLSSYAGMSVAAPSGTITFAVRRVSGSTTVNGLNIRDNCTGELRLTYIPAYTACTAPTAVSVNATNVAPGASVTLSWSGAGAGNVNPIAGYQVYRATSAGGPYSLLTTVYTSAASGSTAVAAPTVNGSSYYYKVLTVGAVSGYDSGQSGAYATLTCYYTAPTAPSSITLNGTAGDIYVPGGNVTLAWSGAAAGTNNAITGYIVYRNGAQYTTVSSTASSGSLSVPAHGTAGSGYSYTVYAQGTYSNSGVSATRYVYTYSLPAAPSSVTVSPAIANAGETATLSWAGAAAGAFNAITGYLVYRATSATGVYTELQALSSTATSASCTVTAPATTGARYYYAIVTRGARGNSAQSTAVASLGANTPPSPPTINWPSAGAVTYTDRPRILVTVGADAEDHSQKLTLSGYTASSTGNLSPGKKVLMLRTTAYAPGTKSISITATDTLGALSDAATRSLVYTVPVFTDASLSSEMTVKAVHLAELRSMVDEIRRYYGMSAFGWAAPVVAGYTSVALWQSHVLELRVAITQIASFVNAWDTTSTVNNIVLPAWITAGPHPTAAVMEQLRDVITVL